MKKVGSTIIIQAPAPASNIHVPQVGSTGTLGSPVAMAPQALVNPKPKR